MDKTGKKSEKKLHRGHGIFFSIMLILLPLILLAAFFALNRTYKYISDNTYETYTTSIRHAAYVADEMIRSYDLHDAKQASECGNLLNTLCDNLNIAEIYVFDIDEKASTRRFLTIGIGIDEMIRGNISTRHIGDVTSSPLSAAELASLHNDRVNNIEHIQNDHDNTLICYIPRHYTDEYDEIIGAEISVAPIISDLQKNFRIIGLIMLLLVMVIFAAVALLLHYRVSRPAKSISRKMNRFVREREEGFEKLRETGSREFRDMSSAFNTMAEEIDLYLKDVEELNRQKSELNVAHTIQKGLLEPAEYRNEAVRIRCCMQPARDVGGDLYDYAVLEDGRIFIAIADVSGKGITAALFMSNAITTLHLYAGQGLSPGRILYEYNNHLTGHNPNFMFITTFVGIYDPAAGTFVYANAGHNFPCLISDSLTLLDGEQGLPAGIMPDTDYPEHTIRVKPGDLLFLYTDGVTEARNREMEFYGEERLNKNLSTLIGSYDKEASEMILQDLSEFTKDTEQMDDITMLTLQIL